MGLVDWLVSKLMQGREAELQPHLDRVNAALAASAKANDATIDALAEMLLNDKKFQEFLVNLPEMNEKEIDDIAKDLAENHRIALKKIKATSAKNLKKIQDHEMKKG